MNSTATLSPYKFLLLVFVFIFPLFIYGQNPYITVWQTDIETISSDPFITEDNEILVPASGEFEYTWVEVENPDNTGSGVGEDETLISFPQPGTYELSMTPTGNNPFHRIKFGDISIDREKLIEISQWGDVEWSSFKQAYERVRDLDVTASDSPDLSIVTDMSQSFKHIRNLVINNIENWDVSHVINMSKMFYYSIYFDPPSLDNWDVSQVENMSYLFWATSYNQPLGNWDVSNVTTMEAMFALTPFNQPIINWDVSNVTNMTNMFGGCSFNKPISKWDVSQVTTMSGMFESSAFNQPLNNWNVSNVTDMSGMFIDNYVFNQPLDQWDVSQVENMAGMFLTYGSPLAHPTVMNSNFSVQDEYDSAFNQDLNSWDVSQVKNMEEMFSGASSFDQVLDEWNLESLEMAWQLFSESGMSCENASISLKGWAENPNTASDVLITNININYSPDIQEEVDFLTDDLNWNMTGAILGTCSLGIEDNQFASLKIYPNPVEDELHISNLSGIQEIQIHSLSGQVLQHITIENESLNLDTSAWAAGVYFASFMSNSGVKSVKKVIKN